MLSYTNRWNAFECCYMRILHKNSIHRTCHVLFCGIHLNKAAVALSCTLELLLNAIHSCNLSNGVYVLYTNISYSRECTCYLCLCKMVAAVVVVVVTSSSGCGRIFFFFEHRMHARHLIIIFDSYATQVTHFHWFILLFAYHVL